MNDDDRPVVIKVGGSLYDLPDLGKRLRAWLEQLDTHRVVLVPGGGPAADAVRLFDRVQGLGEEKSHWLALQALTLNARMLEHVIPGGLASALSDCSEYWHEDIIPILDPYEFTATDDSNPHHLPHSWDVSSDSVAVRGSGLLGAGRLVLLKSITIPLGMNWSEASERGYVDRYFPAALAAAGELKVEAVNFREWVRSSTP